MNRQWSRGEKWLFLISGLVCLPLLVGSWVYERQNELPPPPPTVEEIPPANNAFDLIVQGVAVAPPLPYPTYTRGSCKSANVDRDYSCDNSVSNPLPYTPQYNTAFPLKQKISFLKSAQNSLKLWRDSLSLPLYVPPTMSTAQERLWGHRYYLSALVRIQTHACWQRGDNKAALDWLLNRHREICRSTGSLPDAYGGPIFMDQFANLEKQRAMMFDEIERLSPYLNGSQSRRAALAMQKNRSELPSRVEALKEAKSIAMDLAYRVCQGKTDPYRKAPTAGWKALKFRWTNKKAGLARIERQWDWLIEQEKLPISKQFSLNNELPSDVYMEGNDPFWDLSFQNTPMINDHRASLQINAREVVWETAIAVRAFALDNGRNPRTLNELVPKYLHKIENDPFDSSRQLRYSPMPKIYTQWYRGKDLYTKKLPANAVLYPSGTMSPSGYRQPTGYYIASRLQHLPFLLYSVGGDGRDDGGMDFKVASTKPTSSGGVVGSFNDDILAQAEWFKVSTLPSNFYPVPSGPMP